MLPSNWKCGQVQPVHCTAGVRVDRCWTWISHEFTHPNHAPPKPEGSTILPQWHACSWCSWHTDRLQTPCTRALGRASSPAVPAGNLSSPLISVSFGASPLHSCCHVTTCWKTISFQRQSSLLLSFPYSPVTWHCRGKQHATHFVQSLQGLSLWWSLCLSSSWTTCSLFHLV